MPLEVLKTYKLFVNGEFVRSESGRSDPWRDRSGKVLAQVPRASKKDLRDAVRTATAAQPRWAEATGYLKGQILYRLAEMLEGRKESLVKLLASQPGGTRRRAEREVRAAIDRIVHYAGWTDKYPALLSSVNPVASRYFNFSVPQPIGVVGVVAPEEPALLGLLTWLLPVLATGNGAVVLLSEQAPLPGLDLAEALATSDLPDGVVALLSGRKEDLLPHLARHMEVRALVLPERGSGALLEAERDAAVNVKRVVGWSVEDYLSSEAQGLPFLRNLVEIQTTWHPIGW